MEKENTGRKRECGVVEMHRVVKRMSCNGQGAVKCHGRGKEGGDTEVVWKYCRQEGYGVKYQ